MFEHYLEKTLYSPKNEWDNKHPSYDNQKVNSIAHLYVNFTAVKQMMIKNTRKNEG